MDTIEFAEKIDDARLYYRGRHVGTIGVHYIDADVSYYDDDDDPQHMVIGEMYICQNTSDGCPYSDKKGFHYTWCVNEISGSSVAPLLASRDAIEKELISQIEDCSIELLVDKIRFKDELTLYDLC